MRKLLGSPPVEHREDSIEEAYFEGLRIYEQSKSERYIHDKFDHQKNAIACCQKVIARTGTRKDQLIKVSAYLILIELLAQVEAFENWRMERYFYSAVELGKRYE